MPESCTPGQPRCDEHPGVPAIARCVSCNRLLCSFCRFLYGDRNYCRSCAEADAAAREGGGGTYVNPAGPESPPTTYYYPPGDHYGYPRYLPPPAAYRPRREPAFPSAPWGVGEALLIFAIAFVSASILSLALYAVLRETYSSTSSVFLLLFFSSVTLYTFLLGGTFYSVKVRHRASVSALGLKLQGLGGGFALGLGLGLPLFVAAIVAAYVSQVLLRNADTPDMVSRSVNRVASGDVSLGLVVLLFLTLMVLAPICEEIFFRGYLYPALRNRLDRQPAMLVNGLLFAAAHFEVIGFLPRFLLGWGLCYIYERKRNLSGPMTGHALYNGLILLFSVFSIF